MLVRVTRAALKVETWTLSHGRYKAGEVPMGGRETLVRVPLSAATQTLSHGRYRTRDLPARSDTLIH